MHTHINNETDYYVWLQCYTINVYCNYSLSRDIAEAPKVRVESVSLQATDSAYFV